MMAYIALIGLLAAIGIVLGILQHQGYAVINTLRTIGLWAATIIPLLTLIGLWIISALQILGITLLPQAAQHQGLLIIYFWAFLLFSIPSLITAIFIIRTDGVKLLTCNAPNGGNGGGIELSEQTFEDADVHLYDSDEERYIGEKVTKDALHHNGDWYEAIVYYPDDNIIVAPGIDESMYELRVREDKLERLLTTMREKFLAGARTDARRKEYATEDAARETNRMIRDFERETLVEGELPNSPVRDHIKETEREREDEDHDLREDDYQIPDRADDTEGGDDA